MGFKLNDISCFFLLLFDTESDTTYSDMLELVDSDSDMPPLVDFLPLSDTSSDMFDDESGDYDGGGRRGVCLTELYGESLGLRSGKSFFST